VKAYTTIGATTTKAGGILKHVYVVFRGLSDYTSPASAVTSNTDIFQATLSIILIKIIDSGA